MDEWHCKIIRSKGSIKGFQSIHRPRVCSAAENRIRKDNIQTVEIGANGWILSESDNEAAARRLHNGKRLVSELLAVFFPDVPARQQIVGR